MTAPRLILAALTLTAGGYVTVTQIGKAIEEWRKHRDRTR